MSEKTKKVLIKIGIVFGIMVLIGLTSKPYEPTQQSTETTESTEASKNTITSKTEIFAPRNTNSDITLTDAKTKLNKMASLLQTKGFSITDTKIGNENGLLNATYKQGDVEKTVNFTYSKFKDNQAICITTVTITQPQKTNYDEKENDYVADIINILQNTNNYDYSTFAKKYQCMYTDLMDGKTGFDNVVSDIFTINGFHGTMNIHKKGDKSMVFSLRFGND